jgi:4-diphosphocytidyl-2-C-methyl-D-erythritol kinase
VEVLAPAKLNLFLEILGRRPDGYHEIETLMVAVDLYDRLRFTDDPSCAVTLSCDDPGLPTGSDNLVVRAAERLKAASGTSRGASIELHKAIPTEAGLAGGSSDAAATLAALDRLWDLQSPAGQLDKLAGELGSDVTFFRHLPAAVCRGRGERVEAISLAYPLHFVLVCPPIGLRTAEVYHHLVPPDRPRPIGPVLEAIDGGEPAMLGPKLFNRLQPTAERLEPALVRVRDALANLDPPLDGSLMSGSGSAYFGLASDRDAAAAAARQLEPLGLGRVRVATCGP